MKNNYPKITKVMFEDGRRGRPRTTQEAILDAIDSGVELYVWIDNNTQYTNFLSNLFDETVIVGIKTIKITEDGYEEITT